MGSKKLPKKAQVGGKFKGVKYSNEDPMTLDEQDRLALDSLFNYYGINPNVLPIDNSAASSIFGMSKTSAHYNPISNTIYGNTIENIVSEIPHSIQFKEPLKAALLGAKSYGRSPFINREQQLRQYELNGSLENQAHSVMEPVVRERLLDIISGFSDDKKLSSYKKREMSKFYADLEALFKDNENNQLGYDILRNIEMTHKGTADEALYNEWKKNGKKGLRDNLMHEGLARRAKDEPGFLNSAKVFGAGLRDMIGDSTGIRFNNGGGIIPAMYQNEYDGLREKDKTIAGDKYKIIMKNYQLGGITDIFKGIGDMITPLSIPNRVDDNFMQSSIGDIEGILNTIRNKNATGKDKMKSIGDFKDLFGNMMALNKEVGLERSRALDPLRNLSAFTVNPSIGQMNYAQMGGMVNSTGYLSGHPTSNNPFNIIPSNKITMDGVDIPLKVRPFQEGGALGEEVTLKPNSGEYEFKGAAGVIETPDSEAILKADLKQRIKQKKAMEKDKLFSQFPQSSIPIQLHSTTPVMYGKGGKVTKIRPKYQEGGYPTIPNIIALNTGSGLFNPPFDMPRFGIQAQQAQLGGMFGGAGLYGNMENRFPGKSAGDYMGGMYREAPNNNMTAFNYGTPRVNSGTNSPLGDDLNAIGLTPQTQRYFEVGGQIYPEEMFLGGFGKFLGKVGKGIGKGLGKVASVASDAAEFAAPFVGFIPGAGQILGPALGAAGGIGNFFQNGARGGIGGFLGNTVGGAASGFSGFGSGATGLIGKAGKALGTQGVRSVGNNFANMLMPQQNYGNTGIGGGLGMYGNGMQYATQGFNPAAGQQNNMMSMLGMLGQGNPFSNLFGFQQGGYIPQYQMGGSVLEQNGFQGIQAEVYKGKPEMIALPDLSLVFTNAVKSHKEMDKEEVTDYVPEGSYVFSSHERMEMKREMAENIPIAIKAMPYKERLKGKIPETVNFDSIFPKKVKKAVPSQIAKWTADMYKVLDVKDDVFIDSANEENKAGRLPYIEKLIEFNEWKKPVKLPKFQLGGGVTQAQYGYNNIRPYGSPWDNSIGPLSNTPGPIRPTQNNLDPTKQDIPGWSPMPNDKPNFLEKIGGMFSPERQAQSMSPLEKMLLTGAGIGSIFGNIQQAGQNRRAFDRIGEYGQQTYANNMNALGQNAMLGIAGKMAQDPNVRYTNLDDSILRQSERMVNNAYGQNSIDAQLSAISGMNRPLIDAAMDSGGRNDYMNAMLASIQGGGYNAANNAILGNNQARTNAMLPIFAQRQQLANQNTIGNDAAYNQTTGNRNQLISGITGDMQNYTMGSADAFAANNNLQGQVGLSKAQLPNALQQISQGVSQFIPYNYLLNSGILNQPV